MPIPIYRNQDNIKPKEITESQDLTNLFTILNNPFGLLRSIVSGDADKTDLKNIWLNSKSKGGMKLKVSSSVDKNKIEELKNRGLLEISSKDPTIITLTRKGKKILNESILSDEKCAFSFVKQASKELVSKNSYDFGDEILVKINHSERYGTRYISVKKAEFKNKAKPIKIENYEIKTKDSNGNRRDIKSYSDLELIQALHLAKRIIKNQHLIRVSGKKIRNIPIHRIMSFAEIIMQEINSR